MRFIHISDVHLDTPFAGRSVALRARLRRAAIEALERCVDTAVAERVDAVLIAGDLLDGAHLSFAAERDLLNQLSRLDNAGIQTVYVTGNHDPGDSARMLALAWPPSVTVIRDGNPVAVAIVGSTGEVVGHVVGAGYGSSRETGDLASRLRPVGDSELPQAALLHTQVGPEGAGHPYAPSSLPLMRRAGFDYWALGHVHAPRELSAAPPVRYCGALQGRSQAEAGPRGGLLVDLTDRAHPVVEFREFAPVRWERLTVDGLREARTVGDVVGEAERAWGESVGGVDAEDTEFAAGRTPVGGKDAAATDSDVDVGEVGAGGPGAGGPDAGGPAAAEWVVALELAGPCPIWSQLRDRGEAEVLAQEVSRALGVIVAELRTEQVHPPVRPQDHVERPDVLGATLELAREVAAGRETLGLESGDLAGFDPAHDGSVEAYLQRLLRGAGEEIVELMLDADAADGSLPEAGSPGPARVPATGGSSAEAEAAE